MIKSIIKGSIVYGFGTIASSLLTFILIPKLTSDLNVVDFGIYNIVYLVGLFSTGIFYLGASSALSRYFHDDEFNKESITSGVIYISVLGLIFLNIICLFSSHELSTYLFGNEKYYKLLNYSILASSLTTFNNTFYILLRLKSKAVEFVLLNFTLMIMTLYAILFFFANNYGIYSYFLGTVILQTILMAYFIVKFRSYLSVFNVNIGQFKTILKFGLPIALSGSLFFLLDQVDKFFLNSFSNLSDVAIYSFGAKIGMMASTLVALPFSLVWNQQKIKFHKDNANFYSLIEIVTKGYIYIYIGVLTVLMVFSKDVISLFAAGKVEYNSSYEIIFFVGVSGMFYSLSNILDFGLILNSKTHYMIYFSIGVFIIYFLLNYILLPRFGFVVVAFNKLIVYFIFILILAFFSFKFYFVKIDYSKIVILFALSVGSIYISKYIGLIEKYFFARIILSVFFVIASLAFYFNKEERLNFLLLIKNYRFNRKNH
jgi:O-antigen/teichoic acid export membrane protein